MFLLGVRPDMERCGWALLHYMSDDPTATPRLDGVGEWRTADTKGQSAWKRLEDIQAQMLEWTYASIISRAVILTPVMQNTRQVAGAGLVAGLVAGMLRSWHVGDIIDCSHNDVGRATTGAAPVVYLTHVAEALSRHLGDEAVANKSEAELWALGAAWWGWKSNTAGLPTEPV